MENNVTNNVAENTNATENVVEVLKLDMEAHAPFNPVADTAITTANDLCKIINSIFSEVFKDYYGCKLNVTYVSNYYSYVIAPVLYFKVLDKSEYTKDAVTAFIPMSEIEADNPIARVRRYTRMAANNGVKVEMTENGKSILEEFVIKNNKINNNIRLKDEFDWSQAYNVIPKETGTYINVFKLDIISLLRMIYGDKAADGSRQYYNITPNGPIGAMNQYQKPSNWNLIIMRLNSSNLNYAANQLGLYIQSQFMNDGMPNVITEKLSL